MGQTAHLAFSTWSLNYSSLTSTSFHADLKFSFTPIPFLTWVPWRCCIFIFWFFRLFYILFLLPCPTSFPSKYFIWLIMFVFQNFYFWRTEWWRKTPPPTHTHTQTQREEERAIPIHCSLPNQLQQLGAAYGRSQKPGIQPKSPMWEGSLKPAPPSARVFIAESWHQTQSWRLLSGT